MPEKYGRPLLILAALSIVFAILVYKQKNCIYKSKYNNTLQHDINLVESCQ